MNERRTKRLQELIKERVAQILDHELADPRRGMITVTNVKVDRDLATCIVFWSLIGSDADIRKNERMLSDATKFVQKEVGAVLHTRTVPRVKFIYDQSLVRAQKIQSLLQELAEERKAAGRTTEGETSDPDATEPDESPAGPGE